MCIEAYKDGSLRNGETSGEEKVKEQPITGREQWVTQENGRNAVVSRHQLPSRPSAHLDTGGSNFDRFILSESRNDNPVLDSIIGKFSRRGLDWSSGNLRLVNMQGNSLLGSDLIVHDRSVEIPLKHWLNTFNSILKPNVNYK
uniref:Uncharacterized protein n=1 Tax=Setaria digitata TaxID=48799 RepID=A0A915PY35_9BILA